MRWRLAAATSLRVATYMEARHHPQQGALASKRQANKVRRRCSFTGEQALKQPYA
ncbi:hypothetical protein GQ55_2G370500 [Panicum hallii var. hallii]|uniref:Uncharacterized protein n=1 Tax=Panicum hallii var. hallii TaxID=1504633 RepID=A0A2T7EWF3_9POAL|nr:hypothetical protein GQ55_2G370500 [Panicum hallii var. hallii]